MLKAVIDNCLIFSPRGDVIARGGDIVDLDKIEGQREKLRGLTLKERELAQRGYPIR